MLTVVNEGIYARVYSKYWRNLNTQHWEIKQVPVSISALRFALPLVNPIFSGLGFRWGFG